MDMEFNEEIWKTGVYWGDYIKRIEYPGRLGLPKEVVDLLAEHRAARLWRSPDPRAKRFVLCPPDHRETFMTMTRSHFRDSEQAEWAWRLLCSGSYANIDTQGRINIPAVCLEHADITAPQQVRLLAVGLWYEITALNPQSRGHAA